MKLEINCENRVKGRFTFTTGIYKEDMSDLCHGDSLEELKMNLSDANFIGCDCIVMVDCHTNIELKMELSSVDLYESVLLYDKFVVPMFNYYQNNFDSLVKSKPTVYLTDGFNEIRIKA